MSFYEVVSPRRGLRPAAAHRGDRRLDRGDRPRSGTRSRPGCVWYAEVGADETTIWANFQGADPNAELVEINVRRSVFYPTEHHIDYITVRGFELAQAACPWAPPTADQPGLIGPNWAKGWIIEDNVIHDAKCSAISIGKEASTGHNYATVRGDKPGYQYQLESVFAARQIGWDREHIGSHIIRRNTIYDCGQNGIVGHLGCVFSTIEDNHIYNIALKREFYGYEIGGIKLHAAIDVTIRHNRIHDCSLGTWLDWQTQGTRISRNLLLPQQPGPVRRGQPRPVPGRAQRLRVSPAVAGAVQPGRRVRQQPRLRHRARSSRSWTAPRPTTCRTARRSPATRSIYGGDDRYIGNIFIGGDAAAAYGPGREVAAGRRDGTAGYDGHPASFEEYLARIDDQPPGDHQRFLGVKQPVYIRGNVYAAGASPFEGEHDAARPRRRRRRRRRRGRRGLPGDPAARGVRPALASAPSPGGDLERVRFADADFEERDGTPAVMDVDLIGERKDRTGAGRPGRRPPCRKLTRTRLVRSSRSLTELVTWPLGPIRQPLQERVDGVGVSPPIGEQCGDSPDSGRGRAGVVLGIRSFSSQLGGEINRRARVSEAGSSG